MRLFLDIGHCDRSAKRGVLPGRTIAIVSDTVSASDHGALFACAEGIAGAPEPEQAANAAATALGDAYYAAIETDSSHNALVEAFNAANQAVRTGGERGRAAALAALVLQGRRWFVGHAGDVRVWRYRDLQIKQLTRDHVAPRARRRADVTRACGFADSIDAEYSEGQLKEGDVFLLTSPAVHDVLQGSVLLGVLQSDHTAQQMAETLTQHAFAAHAAGYVGACAVRVEKLPPETAATREGTTLPIIALPEPGAKLDGFVIEKLLLKSRRFRLYQAEDRESVTAVALRFPDPAFAENAHAFLREERAARRIESPFILRPVALRPGRRTALYSVIEYRHAENLSKRIRRKQGLAPAEAMQLAEQLLAALETLHAHGVIHRDIRVHHLFYDKFTRQLWMLGLGIDRADAVRQPSDKQRSNTLSFWAPELFGDTVASEHSDIYATGVAIYRMITAKYPYGKIRSADDWNEPRAYVPLQRYKPESPSGLDEILERACAIDPARRYASAAQFAAALSSVRIVPSADDATPATLAGTDATIRWPWWLAAALAAGLFAYLYFALR